MRAENVIRRKSTWIQGVNAVGVYAVYLMTIFGQAQDSAVAEIAYQRPLLTAIGVAIVVSIVARIVVAIASPKEADKKDERDTNIHRYGEYVGYYVLVLGALAALGLAMAEFEYFWIANAIFLMFIPAALTTSVVKIVAYRRGL